MEDERRQFFGWADYVIFSSTLFVSALIGVYHAVKSANTTHDYLLGGKQMGVLPISLSMAASAISATTLLGYPTDVYLTGAMVFWMPIGAGVGILVATFFLLPFFHRLEVVSANEYLELRFNRLVRLFSSLLYLAKTLFYMAIVVFGPSLALSQVTGIHVYLSVTIVFIICIFYTAIGGIKAVVWTDTIQIFLLYGAVICVLAKGFSDVGGWDVMWQRNAQSDRTEFFNVDIKPTTRHSIWSLIIGGGMFWANFMGTDQASVQRFLAIPSLRNAQWAMLLNWIGLLGIQTLCSLMGLVVYAKYFNCDPIRNKNVEKADQIVPLFVMDTVGSIPGLPGLFVAGVFSGALSTLSSGLNAVPLIILEDFVRPKYPLLSDQAATKIAKLTSVLFGLTCFALAFLVANVKTIMEATISFMGSVSGPVLGVFTFGIFFPRANATGAGAGITVSFILMVFLSIGTQMAKSHNLLLYSTKPLTTEGCTANVSSLLSPIQVNATLLLAEEKHFFSEGLLFILNISYQWYTAIGMLIVWFVGLIVSWTTGLQDPSQINENLMVSCRKTSRKQRGEKYLGEADQPMSMRQIS